MDFETYSEEDIKNGAHKYAAHPLTDVLCLAVMIDNGPQVRLWLPPTSPVLLSAAESIADAELQALVQEADEIHAHNAQFERLIWRAVMVGKYGFDKIPMVKWRCTAALAAYYALPRSLDNVCKALGTAEQKDAVGKKIMLKMCKPGESKITRADWSTLYEYCKQDVIAEHGVNQALGSLSQNEIDLWRVDQKINSRGVPVDVESIKAIIKAITEYSKRLIILCGRVTNGEIKSPRQVAAVREWLKAKHGIGTECLDKAAVATLLKRRDLPLDARRVLEYRQKLGKASVAKFQKMLDCANDDGRIRGTLAYHGASTGRWSGRLIQPQNFPREGHGDEIEKVLFELDCCDTVGDPITAASLALRGCVAAPHGREFVCGDYSQIEARVTAWLACQTDMLDDFRAGKDLYATTASVIFNKPYDDIDKDTDERQVGKAAALALGFGGGIGAFQTFATIYRVDLGSMVDPVLSLAAPDEIKWSQKLVKQFFAKNPKTDLTPQEALAADIVKTKWRAARPGIVALWRGLASAAHQTVLTGKSHRYGRIAFGMAGRFLRMRLPSGRLLSYCDPEIREQKTPWGETKLVVTVMMERGKWQRRPMTPGRWTENAVQAASRDILATGIFNAEKAGFACILSVHDELIAEIDASAPESALDAFFACMADAPQWADGCPVSAAGWRGRRYRKD